MRRLGKLLLLAALSGCSTLDEEERPSHTRQFDTQTDTQYRRTTRTTTTDSWGGNHVSDSSLIWNKQPDGTWKFGGQERR